MVVIKSLSLFLFNKYLYKNISFKIGENERIGLIGRNGSGKTSLFKILTNQLEYDSGTINIDKNLKIGLLTQDIKQPSDKTLIEEAKSAFTRINNIQQQIVALEEKIANPSTTIDNDLSLKLNEQLADYYDELNFLGVDKYLAEIEQVLKGLGFSEIDFNKKVKDFSGGWQMRLELAKIILQKNHLLLLDEPTNHLDISSIIWLENYLKSYPGSIVLISHDKLLLDNLTNRTIEISNQKINDFSFNYSRFLEEKKSLIEIQIKEKKQQDEYIAKTKVLIEKFRYKKSKASFAQKLIKDLEKLEPIEVEQYDLTKIKFNLKVKQKSGIKTLEVKNLAKSFAGNKVLDNLNFSMQRGEKIAIVGANGQGKSVFIKSLINSSSYDGEVNIGHNVEIGYLPQNHIEMLELEKTIFVNVSDLAINKSESDVRNLLGNFFFSGEEVNKIAKVLSGGEKSRLAICKMLVQPHNTLILDEPTNHLDIQVKHIFKQALNSFDGSILIVSHDRDFLSGLVDKVFELKNGRIFEFNGTIDEYLQEKNSEISYLNQIISPKNTAKKKAKQSISKQTNKQTAKIEAKITKAEKQLIKLEHQLTENSQDNSKILKDYDKLNNELEQLIIDWEKSFD